MIPASEQLDALPLRATGALVKIHAAIALRGDRDRGVVSLEALAPSLPDNPETRAALDELLGLGVLSEVGEGLLRSEAWGDWQGKAEARSRKRARERQRKRREIVVENIGPGQTMIEPVTRDDTVRVTDQAMIGPSQAIVEPVTRDSDRSRLISSKVDLSFSDPDLSSALSSEILYKNPKGNDEGKAKPIADSEGQGLMFPDDDDKALDELVASVENLEPLKRVKGLRAYLDKLRATYPEIDLVELARELDLWCSSNPHRVPRKRPQAWFTSIVGKRRRERREIEARAKAEAEQVTNGNGKPKDKEAEDRAARAAGWDL